jgi:hypothetical protein
MRIDVATSALPRFLKNQRVIGLPHHYLYWNSYSNINSVSRFLKAYKGRVRGRFKLGKKHYFNPLILTFSRREKGLTWRCKY